MTLQEKLLQTETVFREAGIDTARLDAEILLSYALVIPRYKIIIDAHVSISEKDLSSFDAFVLRRVAHEPIAYIIGKKEFYGLELFVDRRVLIPRPDTELLVELAAGFAPQNGTMLDICTGSGAVAVALKHIRPDLQISASDLSVDALEVAKRNASVHVNGEIRFVVSDLFDSFADEQFDLITANPPYIDKSISKNLQPELGYEPELALYSGNSGLEVIAEIISSVSARLKRDGVLLMEIGYDQGTVLTDLCLQSMLSCEVKADLSGHDRVAVIRK